MTMTDMPAPSGPFVEQCLKREAQLIREEHIEASISRHRLSINVEAHRAKCTGKDSFYKDALTRRITVDVLAHGRRQRFPTVLDSGFPAMSWSDPRQDDESKAA